MSKHTATDERRYEMMFIIQPQANEAKRKKALTEVRGFIDEAGGKIYHEDDWGRRDLAYSIKGHEAGYYFIFYFEGADPANLVELDQNMRLEADVLRHMVASVPADYEIVKYDLEEEVRTPKKDDRPARKPAAKPKPKAVDGKKLDKKLDQIMKDDDLGL